MPLSPEFKDACLLCGLGQYKNFNAFVVHLKHCHGLAPRHYFDKFLKHETDGICSRCGVETSYRTFQAGYKKYCSRCARSLSASGVWASDKERRKAQSEKMIGNGFSTGRPKGSKNKAEYPITEAVIQRFENHPPPSWLGKKHKESTKQKQSKNTEERIKREGYKGMSYKGRYHVVNVAKYMGNPTNVVYRSSLELQFMKFCDQNPDILAWSSEEVVVPYLDPVQNRRRRYFPDFLIKKRTTDGLILTQMIEIKPKSQCNPPRKPSQRTSKRYLKEATTFAVNQAKWKAAIEFCQTRGWGFVVLTEEDIL